MLLEETYSWLSPNGGAGEPPADRRLAGEFTSEHLKTRILIIEDEMMIAWMIESILSEKGFTEIIMTGGGFEAQDVATDTAPGLIISDVNLGAGLDGVEASVAIVKRTPVPIIFVTAYADAKVRAKIEAQLPSAQILRKPLERHALIEAIQRAFRNMSSN